MQNQILKYKIVDNTVNSSLTINPTKQQVFSLPKEESQMFTSKEFSFNGTRPVDYTNDPSTETENRDANISTSYKDNSSFNPTDYMGTSVYCVPCFIDEDFVDVKMYDLTKDESSDIVMQVGDLKKISTGIQVFRFPANLLNEDLTLQADIDANGGSTLKKNFGTYFITFSPKYIRTNILDISVKKHYGYADMADNETAGLPDSKRRTVYGCDKDMVRNTVWNFEANPLQSGRLFGSVVEVWDSTETQIKQIKVINENEFNFNDDGLNFNLVMSPDNFGYDSELLIPIIGDVLRIYPRETYFNNINIELSYEDESLQVSSALGYLLNDVVRNMKTGIYEVYDSNGVTIDAGGNFDGSVIQRYQIEQFNGYELRKKLKNG